MSLNVHNVLIIIIGLSFITYLTTSFLSQFVKPVWKRNILNL